MTTWCIHHTIACCICASATLWVIAGPVNRWDLAVQVNITNDNQYVQCSDEMWRAFG